MMDDSESELLRRFVEQRDQAAFTRLVERHAPVVLGICRRVLDDHHDAEDAAQAAFIVLARSAVRTVLRPPLGPWLHRVALNLARNALRDRRSRERIKREAQSMPQPTPAQDLFNAEIDAALVSLPERERIAITLFHLEGHSVEQVAQVVGRPVGTVCRWLSTGRERLRHHLVRHGVPVSAVFLISALGSLSAAAVPAGFAAATTAATMITATGTATPAALLASQGIKTMSLIHALKTSLIAAGLMAIIGTAGWIAAADGGGTVKKASDALGALTFMPTAEHPVGWRGDGTGRFPGATPPTSWQRLRSGSGYEVKGIRWMTPLPNTGVSSPIIVGQRIYLTTDFADLVCLDKVTGRILWLRSNLESEGAGDEERKATAAYSDTLAPLLSQLAQANAECVDALNALQATAATSGTQAPPAALAKKQKIEKAIQDHQMAIDRKRYARWSISGFGEAGPTATSDGKRVLVFFATGITACYDLDGNRKWIIGGKGDGTEHGNYASPVLCGNRLIVWAKGEMRSYDVETGKQTWKFTYNSICNDTYGSLFRIQVGNELVAGFQSGWFVRVADGKALWGDSNVFGNGINTPIVEGSTLFASVGYGGWFGDHPGPYVAGGLRAVTIPATTDGGKLVSSANFKTDWAADDLPVDKDKKPYDRDFNASPLYVDGQIYRITMGGGLLVNNAATGEVVYRKVLTSLSTRSQYWTWAGASASPSLAGKYIYVMDNQGTTVVIQPGKEYKEVAKNLIEEGRDGKERDWLAQTLANPVFDGTRMYYRTAGYLYCMGDK